MKCVKSVLGELSSGVSVCRNKGTESDLGAPFLLAPPGRGVRGTLPPALDICFDLSGLFYSMHTLKSNISHKNVKGILELLSSFSLIIISAYGVMTREPRRQIRSECCSCVKS